MTMPMRPRRQRTDNCACDYDEYDGSIGPHGLDIDGEDKNDFIGINPLRSVAIGATYNGGTD